VYEPEAPFDSRRRHVADRHLDALVVVLDPKPLSHGGGEFDPGQGHTSSCEGQCNPARTHGELERWAVTRKLD
ncbi:MAG: hypothetical protein ACLP0H_16265, partial [Terriglobales bacterium]